MFQTVNGGTNWLHKPLPKSHYLWSISYSDAQNGWALGEFGLMLRTRNGGESWEIQNTGFYDYLLGVFFVDQNTGWAVGENNSAFKTQDGGYHWEPIHIFTGSYEVFGSVYFADADTGWIAGWDGTLLKTTDGGSQWLLQTPAVPFLFGISALHFFDGRHGLAVGFARQKHIGSIILQTHDGGVTWTHQIISRTDGLNSIFFINSNTGWIVGNSGVVLKTTDHGVTWEDYQTSGQLNDVFFIDPFVGWVVGAECYRGPGTILKTVDGGKHWTKQWKQLSDEFTKVAFADDQNGWAIGYRGTCVHTTQRGANWHFESGFSQYLHDIYFVDADHGWIVGQGGMIAHRSSLRPDANHYLPDDITLRQNYPNPFNGRTAISFTLQKAGCVNLTLYNLSGQEVAQAFDGNLLAGNHEIQWNAGNLASGVYFYRLNISTTPNDADSKYAVTKKLLLVK